jgi:hypothetical protein
MESSYPRYTGLSVCSGSGKGDTLTMLQGSAELIGRGPLPAGSQVEANTKADRPFFLPLALIRCRFSQMNKASLGSSGTHLGCSVSRHPHVLLTMIYNVRNRFERQHCRQPVAIATTYVFSSRVPTQEHRQAVCCSFGSGLDYRFFR